MLLSKLQIGFCNMMLQRPEERKIQDIQLCVSDINYDIYGNIETRRYNTNGIHNKRFYRLE